MHIWHLDRLYPVSINLRRLALHTALQAGAVHCERCFQYHKYSGQMVLPNHGSASWIWSGGGIQLNYNFYSRKDDGQTEAGDRQGNNVHWWMYYTALLLIQCDHIANRRRFQSDSCQPWSHRSTSKGLQSVSGGWHFLGKDRQEEGSQAKTITSSWLLLGVLVGWC